MQVSSCYFDLSKADKLQMHEFAAGEIYELIQLAVGGSAARKRDFTSAGRLASALLCTGAEEQLEPLRMTVTLGTDEFRHGIFNWRGFLYYKWNAQRLLPKINEVAREIKVLPIDWITRPDEMRYITASKQCLKF